MKHVIITGGSRGIGAAAVRAFSARGDQVAFLYEKEVEQAAAVAAETGALAIRCDVSDEAAVNAAFARLPGADILINNAGIADYDLINVITPERWRRLFAVNVDGAFYCIRAALPICCGSSPAASSTSVPCGDRSVRRARQRIRRRRARFWL